MYQGEESEWSVSAFNMYQSEESEWSGVIRAHLTLLEEDTHQEIQYGPTIGDHPLSAHKVKMVLNLMQKVPKGLTSVSVWIDQVVNGLFNPRYHPTGTGDSYLISLITPNNEFLHYIGY